MAQRRADNVGMGTSQHGKCRRTMTSPHPPHGNWFRMVRDAGWLVGVIRGNGPGISAGMRARRGGGVCFWKVTDETLG